MKFDSDIEYQFLRTLSLLIPMLGELLGLFDLFFRDAVFFLICASTGVYLCNSPSIHDFSFAPPALRCTVDSHFQDHDKNCNNKDNPMHVQIQYFTSKLDSLNEHSQKLSKGHNGHCLSTGQYLFDQSFYNILEYPPCILTLSHDHSRTTKILCK
jgi:hypothetical protein